MRLKVSSAKRRPFCLGLNVLMNMFVLLSDDTWIDFCITCDNARHSSVYRCWQMFQPIHGVQCGEEEYPVREKNTHSVSIHWLCNKYMPFYWAAFHFLWSFLLNASLHRLYWAALWYLSSYRKYLQCPLNTNHQSPSEDRVILGCNA